MNENQRKIVAQVLMELGDCFPVEEGQIELYIKVFSQFQPLTAEEHNEVKNHLHSVMSVRMDRGACVKDASHKTWYYSAKKDLSSDFWERYRTFLYRDAGLGATIIDTLDSATDEMIDMLGNPLTDSKFQRRGLIIGDVQSGKTSTYIGIINKAADAGYKVIILLTGTIEKLRRQTQARVDEGFVGLDSSALIKNRNNVIIGVGKYNDSIQSFVLTSTTSDFNKATATRLSGRLDSFKDPVLFVVKKNKSTLEKLEQWLRISNAKYGEISNPLLLIDDEADNASINTKSEDDPTTINIYIRKLLTLFSRANYVGFTATPYANVFINPESTQEMLHDDLFPRDFIYALEAPSNYVGARSVFSEEGEHAYMLRENNDCESLVPLGHKKDHTIGDLPTSLKEAIVSFFIANAIRDIRGHAKTHRSMLVNISIYVDVQEQICKSIDGYVREMQRLIKNYSMTGERALKYEEFLFMKHVYETHFEIFPTCNHSWEEIQAALHPSVAPIIVRTVNAGNATKNMNYDEFEDGLRLIAIGGYSLSRGLTLEGLCVSYFYRNSKMYDTLMQMGRWFGYREGYADLCQIWMSEEAVDWYSYISIASDELRREVKRMQNAKKTPKEFGLRVRSDKNMLLVTARNKMRYARDYTMVVSLSGEVVETPYLYSDNSKNLNNLEHTKRWLKNIYESNNKLKLDKIAGLALGNLQIQNIPVEKIIEYLSYYESHYLNIDFSIADLVPIIKDTADGTLDLWDLMIAEGVGSEIEFCGNIIRCVSRKFDIKEDSGALQLSGKGSRLGSAHSAKGGLTIELAETIERAEKEEQKRIGRKSSFTQELYFRSGEKRNPLIVIYPVELKTTTKNEYGEEILDSKRKEIVEGLPKPVIGLSIGIPQIDGIESKSYQYKINTILYNELFEKDNEEFNVIEEDEGEDNRD